MSYEQWKSTFEFMASGNAKLWPLIPGDSELQNFYADGLSPGQLVAELCWDLKISETPKKARGGRKIQKAGAEFEDIVEGLAKTYELKQVLTLRKVDPPTRVVGPGRIIYLKNPFADYVGSWTERGGKLLILEAKSTKDDQLSIGSDLKKDQFHLLRVWHHAQAVSAVIWKCENGICFLPTVIISKIIRENARKHVKWSDVEPKFRGRDWVSAMRRIYV